MWMSEIRVAIAGLGNCASALIQGVYYYQNTKEDDKVPGLLHVVFGDYHVRDIKFVAAFDVDIKKIGKDISEAIFAEPNKLPRFAHVPKMGVKVLPAPILDGVAPHMKDTFTPYDPNEIEPVDVAEVLRDVDADVLINFTPVGSYKTTRYYAEAALKAKVGFINAIPEFIASDPVWAKKFEDAGIPVAGDDIKSQLGATILHRTLVQLMKDRGVIPIETYQLNVGGNADFKNMLREERLKTKRISKTEAVTSLAGEIPTRIGPSDYVPFLGDTKIAYIYIKGIKFGGFPVTIEVKLTVTDSPNSAGIVIDVIRAVKIAEDRGIGGSLISISAWAFKHPPIQVPDYIAKQWVEEFIQGKRER